MSRGRVISWLMVVLPVLPAFAASLSGCAYKRDESGVLLVERGQFGHARERVAESASDEPEDRDFILDQMKLVSMGLADGMADVVEPAAGRLYDRLRTQGLNDDKRFASIMLTEGSVRIYKGDPFEQALAFYNIALLDGIKGDWGNMRAASQQSLFLLRDFSKSLQESGSGGSGNKAAKARGRGNGSSTSSDDPAGEDSTALVRAAAVADRDGKSGDALGIDYTPTASDFEIGYALRAIAARRLGETDDMNEAIATLRQIAPRLGDVCDLIAGGNYNTIFVVDYGMAPEKYGSGPDGAIAARAPVTPSADTPLRITAASGSSTWPVITDVNRIASSTKWANMEDIRVAKSTIGSALLAGGGIAAISADDGDDTQQLVGLILAGVGILLKATSSADTRHNELFPQRIYIALAHLDQPINRIELAVEDGGAAGASRLVLPDVPGASADGLSLHYIRMPSQIQTWMTSEKLRYTNDRTGDVNMASECLPYILGGRDVQTPTLQALRDYQRSGYLMNYSLDDLRQLYRDEEIEVAGETSSIDRTGLHVLEGGSWLFTPDPGSIGYKRLYYADHPPYRALTRRVAGLARQIMLDRAARAGHSSGSAIKVPDTRKEEP
ncbi:MAG: hypothetical protein IT435_13850 [Phycisphaerales bacterium]|nr:hypothetical protein [Phycisphaerales bacterium]